MLVQQNAACPALGQSFVSRGHVIVNMIQHTYMYDFLLHVRCNYLVILYRI